MAQPAGDEFALIIETPTVLGFRGSVKTFLIWLQGLPKRGKLAACLGSGLIAGRGLAAPGDEPGDGPGSAPAADNR